MILKLNHKETDVVMSALAMSEAHYRTRMAESEEGAKVYYDKLVETVKTIKSRIEPGRKE